MKYLLILIFVLTASVVSAQIDFLEAIDNKIAKLEEIRKNYVREQQVLNNEYLLLLGIEITQTDVEIESQNSTTTVTREYLERDPKEWHQVTKAQVDENGEIQYTTEWVKTKP